VQPYTYDARDVASRQQFRLSTRTIWRSGRATMATGFAPRASAACLEALFVTSNFTARAATLLQRSRRLNRSGSVKCESSVRESRIVSRWRSERKRQSAQRPMKTNAAHARHACSTFAYCVLFSYLFCVCDTFSLPVVAHAVLCGIAVTDHCH
jgi:hypothetical protein